MPRVRDVHGKDRVRVYVPEVIGKDQNGKDIVRLDATRSMLIDKADYQRDEKRYGAILETVVSGEEPKSWVPFDNG